jgi:hypothetical protein
MVKIELSHDFMELGQQFDPDTCPEGKHQGRLSGHFPDTAA